MSETKLENLIEWVTEFGITEEITDQRIENGYEATIKFLIDWGFDSAESAEIIDHFSK